MRGLCEREGERERERERGKERKRDGKRGRERGEEREGGGGKREKKGGKRRGVRVPPALAARWRDWVRLLNPIVFLVLQDLYRKTTDSGELPFKWRGFQKSQFDLTVALGAF